MPRDMSKAQAAAAAARAARKAKAAEAAAPTSVPKNLLTTQSAAEPFNGADPAAFDHDGDGSPGGSLSMEERAERQKLDAEAAERAAAQRQAAQLGEMKVPGGPAVSKKVRTAEEQEAADRERILSARRVVKGEEAEPMVECRITRKGDGRVSTGQHASGVGEAYFLKGERPRFPLSIAKALEARDFVEIEGEDD